MTPPNDALKLPQVSPSPTSHIASTPLRKLTSTPPRSGFSLIELLLAIAVITILLGILIPTIGNVRRKAEASACASNLRQIFTGLGLYANDHAGDTPFLNAPSQQIWGTLWQQRLEPYCGAESKSELKDSIFWCPAQSPHNPSAGWPGDYAINLLLFRANIFIESDDGKQIPLKLRNIPFPSRFILFADGDGRWTNPAITEAHKERLWPRHSKSADPDNGELNLLFADGHVELRPRSQCLDKSNWLFYETDSIDE